MSAYTPGPWFTSSTHRGDDYDIGAEDSSNVALVNATEGDVKDAATGHANARLIAKAPELLEMLERCVQILSQSAFSDTEDAEVQAAAESLIAEAKGES